jgi:hypothetical protein
MGRVREEVGRTGWRARNNLSWYRTESVPWCAALPPYVVLAPRRLNRRGNWAPNASPRRHTFLGGATKRAGGRRRPPGGFVGRRPITRAPVTLAQSREDDTRHGGYQPASAHLAEGEGPT